MNTRQQIVAAADSLFYAQGYEHTSFAAIADAVQISRGNFYHHFKSKDDILEAVIAERLERTRELLQEWELEMAAPQKRIEHFIEILIRNQLKIMRHGCPVGTLCTELAKLEHAAQTGANAIMALFRDWLRTQFELLGSRQRADTHALHLLARSQGVAVLANSLQDEHFVLEEVKQMKAWVRSLASARQPRSAISSN